MALLGDLVVNLGLNSKKFSAGLGRARGKLATFGAGVGRAIGSMAKFGLAAGVAGVAVGGLLVRNSMKAMDAVAKLSDRLGIATEDIVAFQHAGQLMGASSEEVNKGLEQLTKRLGEVATLGTGEAKNGLDALGLSADTLTKMPLADAMGLIADKMNGLATQSDKAAVANALFGRAGIKMLNFLSLGSEGLAEAAAEAERLGITFSRVDAAQVEAANDAILRMKQGFAGIGNQLAVALGPTIANLADGMADFVSGTVSGFKAILPIVTQAGNLIGTVFSTAVSFGTEVFGLLTGTVGANMSDIGTFITDAMLLGEFAVKNWESIAELAFKQVALFAIETFNEFTHFFTGVIPALLDGFGKNWGNTWRTALDAVLTGLINFGTNVRNIMGEIWEFIKSGGSKDLALTWTPLMDGFHSSIEQIEIPDRVKSRLEEQMAADVQGLKGALDTDLVDFMVQRRAELDALTKPLEVTPTPDVPTGDDLSTDKGSGKKLAGALRKGSAAAFSRIVQASAKKSGETKELEKQTKIENKILDGINEMNQTFSVDGGLEPAFDIVTIG